MPSAIRAVDPRSGALGSPVHETAAEDLESLLAAAAAAASDPRLADTRRRADLLREVSARLGDLGQHVADVAARETGLSEARLASELARTRYQLTMFADAITGGDHFDVMIDTADPDATPSRPDLRRMMIPIGPVVVFGASNFPLAFSTAGGDTASALAAGCPVIVKAHPAHPQTGALVAAVLNASVHAADLPAGTFGHAVGADNALGEHLVDDPRVEAIAFTGSEVGGRALATRAAARPRPIPVFAEMGSLNPVVLTERALVARGAFIAERLADSVTGSGGQLCTKPGVVFVPAGRAGDGFCRLLGAALSARGPQTLLTQVISARLREGLDMIDRLPGIHAITPPTQPSDSIFRAAPVAYRADVDLLSSQPALLRELFGPAVLVLTCHGEHELLDGVGHLAGQLTATVHAEPDDFPTMRPLLDLLGQRAGRVVFNAYPTGLSPGWALQHGGPFPASTNAAVTSVGVTAMRRFLRPIAFQDFPDALLPPAVQEGNPLNLTRRMNGVLQFADAATPQNPGSIE